MRRIRIKGNPNLIDILEKDPDLEVRRPGPRNSRRRVRNGRRLDRNGRDLDRNPGINRVGSIREIVNPIEDPRMDRKKARNPADPDPDLDPKVGRVDGKLG